LPDETTHDSLLAHHAFRDGPAAEDRKTRYHDEGERRADPTDPIGKDAIQARKQGGCACTEAVMTPLQESPDLPKGDTFVPAPLTQGANMAASASVLVVDDNLDNRDLLAEYLTFVGCTVATVSTGAEAITVAEAVRPQVVLMDLGLPGGLDGWDATHRIKSHPLLNQTVVIAVTAHGFPAEVERAMRAGCHAVVVKPYDLVALGRHVQLLVSERQRIES